MEFNIKVKDVVYNFELDEYGQVWFLEEDADLGVLKNAFNHETTRDINVAKQIAKKMLYSKGLLD